MVLLHLQQRTDTLLCLGEHQKNKLTKEDRHQHLTHLASRNIFWPGAENNELTKDRHLSLIHI